MAHDLDVCVIVANNWSWAGLHYTYQTQSYPLLESVHQFHFSFSWAAAAAAKVKFEVCLPAVPVLLQSVYFYTANATVVQTTDRKRCLVSLQVFLSAPPPSDFASNHSNHFVWIKQNHFDKHLSLEWFKVLSIIPGECNMKVGYWSGSPIKLHAATANRIGGKSERHELCLRIIIITTTLS